MSKEIYIEKIRNLNYDVITLESLITLCIYKYCQPSEIALVLVESEGTENKCEGNCIRIDLNDFVYKTATVTEIPWEINSCKYPVARHSNTIISGLCAVARFICMFNTTELSGDTHEEGLLGFRKSCLQAPNEVSVWAKFCEVELVATATDILIGKESVDLTNLYRFENHMRKPVKIHNVYKVARDKAKLTLSTKTEKGTKEKNESAEIERNCKQRKWKSKNSTNPQIASSTPVEDLDVSHKYAEGPFMTLADLIIYPSMYVIIYRYGIVAVAEKFRHLYDWYSNMSSTEYISNDINEFLLKIVMKNDLKNNLTLPADENVLTTIPDVSLYKCDPKRNNPKKRLFTKEDDINSALASITDLMELTLENQISSNNEKDVIEWDKIPSVANPKAGYLPESRMLRKSQQLENLALAVMKIAEPGDKIVDFCSGGGHLGILIACLVPQCTVILLENKEQSLMRARYRVEELKLKNVYFYQCNLDFYVGRFEIGVALHACGVATDLVLEKCLAARAKFVICPCCYGSLHQTGRLNYPRSNAFSLLCIDDYLCISHTADQTHDNHPLAARGYRCMNIIDSDRGRYAKEKGYKVTLSKLNPLNCTPKNNLLIGIPS